MLRCVCELEGKPMSSFSTEAAEGAADVAWNHTAELADVEVGDCLTFSLRTKESSETLGEAAMKLGPGGFAGELPLRCDGAAPGALLKLRITAGAG